MRIAADLFAVRDLAGFLRTACLREGIDESDTADLELALVEAANNVVEHGYGGEGAGDITLELRFVPDAAELILSDRGRAAPPDLFSTQRDMPFDALAGRGIGIIQACIDEIDYSSESGRNRLSLRKRRSV